jgi:simple sugar transport system substrate-binding protein
MKKIVIITMVIVLLISSMSLFAGGAKEEAKSKTYTIATVVKVDGHVWFERMRQGVDAFDKASEHTAFMVGPAKADAAEQVKIVEDLIAQNVDAICIVPLSIEAVEPVLKKAREQGIVVIAHEASSLQNVDYIIEAFDNHEYGAVMMDSLAQLMGEKGDYLAVVGFLTSKSHMEQIEGAVARQKQAYPEMRQVGGIIEDNTDTTIAYNKIKEALLAYPSVTGIIGAPMTTSVGAGLAVEEAGKANKINVVSTGMVSVTGQYLTSGAVKKIQLWDPKDAGIAMNELALLVLEGKKDQIKAGLDLGLTGYDNLLVPDVSRPQLLFGSGWITITKDNMAEYNF